MPTFEMYNQDGTLQINLASRLTKYLGVVTINANASGSLVDTRFAQGTPWYFLSIAAIPEPRGYLNPTISFSGNTLSWAGRTGQSIPISIVYGIYSNGSN